MFSQIVSRSDGRSGIGRVRYAAQAASAIAAEPAEGVERVSERIAEWRDNRRALPEYSPVQDWERILHEHLGAPWPCRERDAFEAIWDGGKTALRERGMVIGRGAYGGWDDGDASLVRAAWCATRHLQPHAVLETGVARGLTTRALLEGLAANGRGQLWSVDLPPLLERELSAETAAAVPDRLRDRWTLVRGSSRRALPDLLAGTLRRIDLFVHDSMHTTRNVRFELESIWPRLAPGGVAMIDDIERNAAFQEFLGAHSEAIGVACRADDGRALFGCLLKQRAG